MAKTTLSAKVREYIKQHPNKKVTEIAKELEVKYQYVYIIKKKMERRAAELTAQGHRAHPVTGKILMQVSEHPIVNPQIEIPITMEEPKHDPVNHPAHYKYGGIETIDFIEAKELGYNLGNVVKYITRSDHKGNRKQDLEKALWYLTREINSIK
jgi:hypothetical protein